MKGKSRAEKRLAEVQRLLGEVEPEVHYHGNSALLRVADEVDVKSPVFYAVMVAGQLPMETVEVLNQSWAGGVPAEDITFFIQREGKGGNDEGEEREGEENNEGQRSLQLNLQTTNNIHLLPSSTRAEVQVLKYICHQKLNSNKWFFISNSDVYVKTLDFERYLNEIDVLQYHYGYLGKPIKRDAIGRVCMPGPGSVLSHVTMQEICAKVEECDIQVPLTDCPLGECVRRLVPRLQCNKEGHPHDLFLKFDGGKRGPITELKHREILNRALTIYPVSDGKLMYAIHQVMVAERLNTSQNDLQETKSSIDRMADLLPRANLLVHQEREGAMTRYDIIAWALITSNQLMSDKESDPVMKVPAIWKSEVDSLIRKVTDYLSFWEDGRYTFKRIVNGYFRVLPQLGIDYIIDFEGKEEVWSEENVSPTSKHFRVTLSRRFDSLEVDPVIVKSTTAGPRHITIAVVTTTGHSDQFQGFMLMLDKVLEDDQKINLIVINMKAHEKDQRKSTSVMDAKSILSLYDRKYPQASFTVLDSPTLLSREHGLSLVVRELRPSDVVFLADLNLQFDRGFLERCRHLPLQGQQAYFPTFFSKLDPAFLTEMNHVMMEDTISEHSGHWLHHSNSVGCLYAADIFAAVQQGGAKGIPNSIVVSDLYNTLIDKGYEVVTATDKGLKLNYVGERDCGSWLVGEEKEECTRNGQDYSDLYTRMQLSALLFDHEGADKF